MRDSTPVITANGVKAIADLTHRDRVLSWSPIDKSFCYQPTTGGFPKDTARLYRVVTVAGEFYAAGHHRVLLHDQTYARVADLRIGTHLTLYNMGVVRNTGVISIEKLKKQEWYFDQHVYGTNNYVTLDGTIHHNSGKSQAGTFRTAHLMSQDPGINCAYYFPTYDLINMRGIPGMVKDLNCLGLTNYTINKSDFTIKVEGFGNIYFRSYDRPERIVAYEVAHSVVDELDTLPRDKAEYVWRKVVERNRQACSHPAGNTVAVVTTPDQGTMGFVYEKWGKPDRQDGYELIKASTRSNPFIPDDYADSILKNYNEELRELYLDGEFISLAQRTVFEKKSLEKAMLECFSPRKRMAFETGLSRFTERPDGELLVWDDPKPGTRYVIGADVSEGLSDGDYSCADVLSLPYGEQVAHWHGKIAPDLYAKLLKQLGERYNNALVGVEANNHGMTVNILLRDYGYSNIYVQKAIDDRGSSDKETRRLGWLTTSKSKPYIIDQLAAELREQTHGIVNEKTVIEMQTYIVQDNGSYNAQAGCHDDRVMARAIAGEMLRSSPSYRGKTKRDDKW